MANGRNSGAVKKDQPHIRLYWEMMDSNAWRCLSASDQRAYIGLKRQLSKTNNGTLALTLTKARDFGIASPATLAKSLRALVAVGLIAVTRKGGCQRDGSRLATLYRLTEIEVYECAAKLIDASKATNEWKTVTTKAMGHALIRQAEDQAALLAAPVNAKRLSLQAEKKAQLQFLAVTTSKTEAVQPSTASKNEPWTPIHDSKNEAGKRSETDPQANGGAGFAKSDESSDSAVHTSKSEYLITTTTPLGQRTVIGSALEHTS